MNVDVREHKFPFTPKEIVEEGNRLMSVVLAPAADNYDEIKWMTQNGWLETELNMSKTEKFIELERMLSNEKEKLESKETPAAERMERRMTLKECEKRLDDVLAWARVEFERLNSHNRKTEASFMRVVRGMRKRIDETLPAEWAQRVCLITDHEDGYSTRTVEIEINMPKKTMNTHNRKAASK